MSEPLILLPEMDNLAVSAYIAGEERSNVIGGSYSLETAFGRLNDGQVDAVIAGASHTTTEVLRQAIKQIGVDGTASSFMIMEKGDEHFYVTDPSVIPEPTVEQLVDIAERTCANVARLGETAIVAFLSFSTFGSAINCAPAQKVKKAYEIFAAKHPEIPTYGEMQFDSAWNENTYIMKTGELCYEHGKPNVFIFPDLNSANIGYKIMQELAGYTAVGPILQGFKRPVYDLSRGVTQAALSRICDIVTKLNTETGDE